MSPVYASCRKTSTVLPGCQSFLSQSEMGLAEKAADLHLDQELLLAAAGSAVKYLLHSEEKTASSSALLWGEVEEDTTKRHS